LAIHVVISSWVLVQSNYEDHTSTCEHQAGLKNKPQKKQTSKPLAMIHICIIGSLVQQLSGGERRALSLGVN